MATLRPADLAREHGISPQAVRNYERDRYLPPARRTRNGYRIYTETHAAALRAYLALTAAYGYPAAGRIMTALHRDALPEALTAIDRGHAQMLRDRETLDLVRKAVNHLTARVPADRSRDDWTIGELARHLGVTAATVRNWEGAGIVVPARDPDTGYRVFHATDVRDAELAHLLRRGRYPLEHIATVVEQIRTAGGTGALNHALDDWERKLTAQGLAMLTAATRLDRYLAVRATASRTTSANEQPLRTAQT